MVAIVIVDEYWGIGYNGDLLFTIPEDMKFFKEFTMNKVVVMGHSTFKSLPGGKPLKGRINIVLSRKKGLSLESAIICDSIEQLLDTVNVYNPDDVIVIGGQEIYSQLLDYCNAIYLTKVKADKKADKHFPSIDSLENWAIGSKSDEKEYGGLKYTFYKYINTNMAKTDT